MRTAEGGPGPWTWALVAVLAVGLGLRLWGIKHGLPYAYNLDEGAHFVPTALSYFRGSLDPDYFINPPLLGYVLWIVYWAFYGSREAAHAAYALEPTEVFTLSRTVVALLGTGGLLAVWAAGRRLFDERVGVIAAAILAVGFLPVFYSKQALNDVPALLPLGIALFGAAGLVSRDLRRDWIYGAAGLGLAAATKYTAAIVALPLLAAVGYRLVALEDRRRETLLWILGGGALAGAVFSAANPYALIDPREFLREGVLRQQSASNEIGKLGQTETSGHLYYLWTITWGLGWGVAVAALAGIGLALREHLLRALILVPAPLVFIAFMGAQGRFFGRWLLPALPFIAILAAYAGVRAWELVRDRRPPLRHAAAILVALALLGQGTVYSVHAGIVGSREDTRNLAREWLVENVPAGSKLVIEPIVPQPYIHDPGDPNPATPSGNRWIKYPVGRSTVNPATGRSDGKTRVLNVEDFERTARPSLLRRYIATSHCWVMTGSWQYGRAFDQPEEVPRAVRYYRELVRRGVPVFSSLPYERQAEVGFNFDWTFDYYPLAYDRPGPEVFIYRIPGPDCPPLPRRAGAPGLDIDAWLRR